MEEGETQRLRYSVWPEQTLEVSQVPVWPVEIRDEWLLVQATENTQTPDWIISKTVVDRMVNLPSELYLREVMELDLQSEQRILAFVAEYGPPFSLHDPGGDLAPWLTDPDEPLWLDDVPRVIFGLSKRSWLSYPLGLVRLHIWSIRNAARLWQLQTGQLTLEQLQTVWEPPAPAPQSADEATQFLADILNGGLKPFHARLEIFRVGQDEHTWTIDSPGLYSALCLQLFNNVAEEAVYITCHNETCGRLFVRQRGRAKQGKYHTTGVKYCSDYCARAQGQREIRRRKAKSPRRGKGGES